MPTLFAVASDAIHLLAMIGWAGGFPLLFVRHWPRLRLAYTLYALLFVGLSQISHHLLGECFLTTLSRWFWEASGKAAPGTFTMRLVNAVAGIRPSERVLVIAWEAGIAATAAGTLWSLLRVRSRPRRARVG